MALCMFAAAPVFLYLWDGTIIGDGSDPGNIYLLYALLGALTFAPHVLTSLCARSLLDQSVASTSMGAVKAAGQIGGTLAGSPMGALAARQGWQVFGYYLMLASLISSACYALAYLVEREELSKRRRVPIL